MTDFRLGVDFDPPDADQRRIVLLEKEGAPGIVVLGHSQFRHHSSSAEEHTHEGCLEIVLCQRGALAFQNGRKRYSLMPGDLLINRPGERHRLLTYPKGLALYWMLVRVEPPGAPLLKLPAKERRTLRAALLALSPQVRRDDGTVRHAFARLFAYLEAPRGDARSLGLIGTSLHLLLATLQTARRDKPSHVAERLEQTIAQIRQAPGKDYRVDDLARQAALSPSRFIERFKQITGMPPRHFLLDCRLEQAKHALEKTATPITKLALDLGFDSSQHFANTFKRATGTTPTQWRAAAARGTGK
jgi:AraC-like DNA-binding protein